MINPDPAAIVIIPLPHPFGMLTPGRSWEADSRYRFGFNTQEQTDELYGNGNSTTAEYWEYDTRLGRRANLDPVKYGFISPYACFANNPILFIDIKGDSVGYEKFRDRINVLWGRITDRNVRTNFRNYKSQTTMYIYAKRNNVRTLPNTGPGPTTSGPINNGQISQPTSYILYSTDGITSHPVVIGNKDRPCIKVEKEREFDYNTDNRDQVIQRKLRLNGRCDNTSITLESYGNPDAFQIDDKSNDVIVLPNTLLGPPSDYPGLPGTNQILTPNTNGRMVVTVTSTYDIPNVRGNRRENTKYTITYWKHPGIYLKIDF